MKIWHRLGFFPSAESTLQELGLQYECFFGNLKDRNKVTSIGVLIDESNPAWPAVSELGGGETMLYTEFTTEEVLAAEWLIARPNHSIGYALPSGISWSKEYYELGCKKCGVNWKQIAPYRVSPKTRMGRYAFASFWGGFELFCSTDVLSRFQAEKITGYDTWPLLLTQAKAPLPGIQQLRFEHMAEPAIVEELAETKYFAKRLCPQCNQIWYNYYRRGMMPLRREALRKGVDFLLTHEWFGSEPTARREIIVSKRIAHLVMSQKWKGLSLSPIQLV